MTGPARRSHPFGPVPAAPAPQPQMLPGMHVQVGPMTYQVSSRMVQTPQGLRKQIILRVEHAAGMSVFPMDTEFARKMGDALTSAATGLEVAR